MKGLLPDPSDFGLDAKNPVNTAKQVPTPFELLGDLESPVEALGGEDLLAENVRKLADETDRNVKELLESFGL